MDAVWGSVDWGVHGRVYQGRGGEGAHDGSAGLDTKITRAEGDGWGLLGEKMWIGMALES